MQINSIPYGIVDVFLCNFTSACICDTSGRECWYVKMGFNRLSFIGMFCCCTFVYQYLRRRFLWCFISMLVLLFRFSLDNTPTKSYICPELWDKYLANILWCPAIAEGHDNRTFSSHRWWWRECVRSPDIPW